jgi:hypothetical protein
VADDEPVDYKCINGYDHKACTNGQNGITVDLHLLEGTACFLCNNLGRSARPERPPTQTVEIIDKFAFIEGEDGLGKTFASITGSDVKLNIPIKGEPTVNAFNVKKIGLWLDINITEFQPLFLSNP